MNFSYLLKWQNCFCDTFEKRFSLPIARDRFIKQEGENIKQGHCYIDRLDGNGDIYQYSFDNPEIGWAPPL